MSAVPMPETSPELPLRYPFPPGRMGTPPPLVHWAREHRPVCPVRLPSGAQAWMITNKDDIAAVFTDRRFSRNLAFHHAPRIVGDDTTAVQGSIFNLDPPDHTRVRRIVAPYYSRAATERHRAEVTRLIDETLDVLADGPTRTADLVESFAAPLPPAIACALLKIPPEMVGAFVDSFSVQTAFRNTPAELATASTSIAEFSRRIVESRRDDDPAERDDPIGALLTAHENGTLSEAELHGTASYLIVVGVGSLVSPLATGPLTLLLHGDQLRECRADPDLWPRAAEEVLRYHHNGVLGLPRIATEDVDMHGVTIRRGDAVCATMLGATWDPSHYRDPARFDVHRTENADPTFGAGPHFCLGVHQARMVVTIALKTLFVRFTDLELAVPEHEISFDTDSMFILPSALPVSWNA
ncbi:cytochrome P450 [Amycolatopsis suaedae]|uniref:Cytochrome P450 n=1 Tax=Amycolatopsis suaedae TaxID=2510978 RepID=A0A4Q7JA03_9PSEU|nr:cytochrome P450 [Amycolatopsis suaedae]RZQ64601.1 cytochrome P450 [Amycolatopsis suaedae]